MKKLIFILIAVVAALISCQVNKTTLPAPNTALVGTWFLKAQVSDNIIQGVPGIPDTVINFTTNDFYKFNVDYTVNVSTSMPTASVATHYYSYAADASGQVVIIGGSNSKNFTTYIVNKLSKDSLLLYSSVSQTLSGVAVVTNTSYMFTH